MFARAYPAEAQRHSEYDENVAPSGLINDRGVNDDEVDECYGFGSFKDIFSAKARNLPKNTKVDLKLLESFRMLTSDLHKESWLQWRNDSIGLLNLSKSLIKGKPLVFSPVAFKVNGAPYSGGLGELHFVPCGIAWLPIGVFEKYCQRAEVLQDTSNTSNTSLFTNLRQEMFLWEASNIQEMKPYSYQSKGNATKILLTDGTEIDILFVPGPFEVSNGNEVFIDQFSQLGPNFISLNSSRQGVLFNKTSNTSMSIPGSTSSPEIPRRSDPKMKGKNTIQAYMSQRVIENKMAIAQTSEDMSDSIMEDVSQAAEEKLSRLANIFEDSLRDQEINPVKDTRDDDIIFESQSETKGDDYSLIRQYVALPKDSPEAHFLAQQIKNVYNYPIGPTSVKTKSFQQDIDHRKEILEKLSKIIQEMNQCQKKETKQRMDALKIRNESLADGSMEYINIESGKLITPEEYKHKYLSFVGYSLENCFKFVTKKKPIQDEEIVEENTDDEVKSFMDLLHLDITELHETELQPPNMLEDSKVKDFKVHLCELLEQEAPIRDKDANDSMLKSLIAQYETKIEEEKVKLFKVWDIAFQEYEDMRYKLQTEITEALLNSLSVNELKEYNSLIAIPDQAIKTDDDENHRRTKREKANRRKSIDLPTTFEFDEEKSSTSTQQTEYLNQVDKKQKKSRRQSIVTPSSLMDLQNDDNEFFSTGSEKISHETSQEPRVCELCCDNQRSIEFSSCSHGVCTGCWSHLQHVSSLENPVADFLLCPWDRIPISMQCFEKDAK